MMHSNSENLAKLSGLLGEYKSILTLHPCERKESAILSSEQVPLYLHAIKSTEYDVFRQKTLKTTLVEIPDKKWTDFYILFQSGNVRPLLMGHIAKVFPGARDNFQSKFIDSLVLHLMAIAKKGVTQNTLLFPDILVPHINKSHSEKERLEHELMRYGGNPVAAIICNENSNAEKNIVLDSLKIPGLGSLVQS